MSVEIVLDIVVFILAIIQLLEKIFRNREKG